MLGHYSTIIGVALCVGIFSYLSCIARRAVDDELQDEALNREETMALLSDDAQDSEEKMAETSLSNHSASRVSLPSRLSFGVEDRFVNGSYEEAAIGLGH